MRSVGDGSKQAQSGWVVMPDAPAIDMPRGDMSREDPEGSTVRNALRNKRFRMTFCGTWPGCSHHAIGFDSVRQVWIDERQDPCLGCCCGHCRPRKDLEGDITLALQMGLLPKIASRKGIYLCACGSPGDGLSALRRSRCPHRPDPIFPDVGLRVVSSRVRCHPCGIRKHPSGCRFPSRSGPPVPRRSGLRRERFRSRAA